MAETTTTNYAWTMPDPGASANTWGSTLNATTQKIDAQVYTNQQAGVPVGAVTMFVGATAPTNWLLCQGQSLSTTTYAGLFAVIGYAFGGSGASFNLPNLTQKFPIGAGPNPLGQSGGAFSVTLGIGNIPAHSHSIQDPSHYHTISQGSHSHGVNQWAHSHTIITGGHSHGVSVGSHSHGLTQSVGLSYTTSGGAGSQTVTAGAGPIRTDTAGNLGGSTDVVGNLGGGTDGQTSAISIQASGTGVTNTDSGTTNITTTDPIGSGAAFNVTPPFQAINFIIRYA